MSDPFEHAPKTIEETTAAEVWQIYRESQIPEDAAPFVLERMESGWLAGAYFALVLAKRLERESEARRESNMSRLLLEINRRLHQLDLHRPGKPS